jgi:HEXXH motif-containing protein
LPRQVGIDVEARTILWTDTGIYQERFENTATALMATARALELRHPLGGAEREFLSLYGEVAGAPAEIFTRLWVDPYAYFWTRFAYELTQVVLGADSPGDDLENYCASLGAAGEPRRALELHLGEFKKFVLALDLLSRRARRFDRPLCTARSFSIPGTAFAVIATRSIEIIGSSGAGLEVSFDRLTLHLGADSAASDRGSPRLVECPLVRVDDVNIVLKGETFSVPGLDLAAGLCDGSDDNRWKRIELLREGLVLVRRHQPWAFEHIAELVRVVAFKPATPSTFTNISFSDLPGAIVLSAVPQPYWIADGLVHEMLHHRLFFILEAGDLFEEVSERNEIYSPWRHDLRPPTGLLHANYVYLGVARFWHSVCASGETTGLERQYAEDQAVRAVLQLKIGITQMGRYAKFTARGLDLFRQMKRETDDLLASIRKLNLSPDAPATIARSDGALIRITDKVDGGRQLSILESLEAHENEFDLHRQCVDLRAILRLG